MRGEVVLMFLAFVAYSVHAAPGNAHKKHTVVAIVVKHTKAKNGAAVLKIDGHKISAVSPPATVPQNVQPARPAPVAPVPANFAAKPFLPVNTAPAPAPQPLPVPVPVPQNTQPLPFKPVPVPQNTQPLPFKPVPVPQNKQPLLFKLVPVPRKTQQLPVNPAPVKQNTQPLPALVPIPQKGQPVAVKQNNQASDVIVDVNEVLQNDDKKKKKKENDLYKQHPEIYPCDDYSPVCHYYHIQAPDKAHIAQCRDVWMQQNCRKTCGFCHVPWGAFLGCNDLDNCKKMAKSACLHDWVKQTCRAKCGICSPFERVGSSGVFVGKKKAEVPQTKNKADEMDEGSGATEEESMDAREEEEEDEEEEAAQEDQEVEASGGDTTDDETPQDEEAEASGGDATDEELEEGDDENKGKEEDKKTTKQRRMILSHRATQ